MRSGILSYLAERKGALKASKSAALSLRLVSPCLAPGVIVSMSPCFTSSSAQASCNRK